MVCEICQKNQATVHMAEFNGGSITERHLCTQCAKGSGFGDAISFQDIFQGFLNHTGEAPLTKQRDEAKVDVCRCPECGFTYDDVRTIGKLGCPSCYKAFETEINKLLKSIHTSNLHKGKIPVAKGGIFSIKKERNELKKQLAQAVAMEEFEDAARLRDSIRALEKEAGL